MIGQSQGNKQIYNMAENVLPKEIRVKKKKTKPISDVEGIGDADKAQSDDRNGTQRKASKKPRRVKKLSGVDNPNFNTSNNANDIMNNGTDHGTGSNSDTLLNGSGRRKSASKRKPRRLPEASSATSLREGSITEVREGCMIWLVSYNYNNIINIIIIFKEYSSTIFGVNTIFAT